MNDDDKPIPKMTALEILFWFGYALIVSGFILLTYRQSPSFVIIEIGTAIVLATFLKLLINDAGSD